MEFFIIKEKILDSLKKINNITYYNLNKNYEKNILISINNNFLYIIGNNLDIEINVKIILDKSYESDTISISYKKLLNICKFISSKTNIKFYNNKNFLFLKTEETEFSLSLFPINDFPKFNIKNKKYEICLSKKNFLYLIKQTCFSMAVKDIRTCLNGMLFKFNLNEIKTITTDGHRLSLSKMIINNNILNKISFIMYRKSIIELIKFLNCNDDDNFILKIYEKFIIININNYKFISRLLNENFPNCDNIINNTYKYNIIINKELFKNSIYRISSILEENYYLIKLIFFNNKMILYSENFNHEYAKEEILINYSYLNTEIGLNFNYIIDILSSIENKNIIFKFSDNISSIEINEENNLNKKYILMPIKI